MVQKIVIIPRFDLKVLKKPLPNQMLLIYRNAEQNAGCVIQGFLI